MLRTLHWPALWAAVALLTVAALLAGCGSTPGAAPADEAALANEEEDSLSDEVKSSKRSAMLDKLRESNRRASQQDRQQDLDLMRAELTELDKEIADADVKGESTLPLTRRRENLAQAIAAEERMLRNLGDQR